MWNKVLRKYIIITYLKIVKSRYRHGHIKVLDC